MFCVQTKYLKILFSIILVLCVWLSYTSANLNWPDDIWSPNFIVETWTFTPSSDKITGWGNGGAIEDANFALGFIVQQLMLFIGAFSLFVMTIWAGYMILHRWDDASLSKWKEIFVAWILWLTVALFSYYMVSLARFIIYSV